MPNRENFNNSNQNGRLEKTKEQRIQEYADSRKKYMKIQKDQDENIYQEDIDAQLDSELSQIRESYQSNNKQETSSSSTNDKIDVKNASMDDILNKIDAGIFDKDLKDFEVDSSIQSFVTDQNNESTLSTTRLFGELKKFENHNQEIAKYFDNIQGQFIYFQSAIEKWEIMDESRDIWDGKKTKKKYNDAYDKLTSKISILKQKFADAQKKVETASLQTIVAWEILDQATDKYKTINNQNEQESLSEIDQNILNLNESQEEQNSLKVFYENQQKNFEEEQKMIEKRKQENINEIGFVSQTKQSAQVSIWNAQSIRQNSYSRLKEALTGLWESVLSEDDLISKIENPTEDFSLLMSNNSEARSLVDSYLDSIKNEDYFSALVLQTDESINLLGENTEELKQHTKNIGQHNEMLDKELEFTTDKLEEIELWIVKQETNIELIKTQHEFNRTQIDQLDQTVSLSLLDATISNDIFVSSTKEYKNIVNNSSISKKWAGERVWDWTVWQVTKAAKSIVNFVIVDANPITWISNWINKFCDNNPDSWLAKNPITKSARFTFNVSAWVLEWAAWLVDGLLTMVEKPVQAAVWLGALVFWRDPETWEWFSWETYGDTRSNLWKAMVAYDEWWENAWRAAGKTIANIWSFFVGWAWVANIGRVWQVSKVAWQVGKLTARTAAKTTYNACRLTGKWVVNSSARATWSFIKNGTINTVREQKILYEKWIVLLWRIDITTL